MGKNILVVEDDLEYAAGLEEVLVKSGYSVTSVSSPIDGLEKMQEREYNLVISDLMMDSMDGIRFIAYIKRDNPSVKTIILTGFPTADTEINAIDINVDQYLEKKVHKGVLLKYVEALLTEQIESDRNAIVPERVNLYVSKKERIKVDNLRHEVYKDDKLVMITNKEYDLLCFFLSNKNVALSRDEIFENVWESGIEKIESRVIDTHIKTLRKKLFLVSLKSIRGFGYKWDE